MQQTCEQLTGQLQELQERLKLHQQSVGTLVENKILEWAHSNGWDSKSNLSFKQNTRENLTALMDRCAKLEERLQKVENEK